MRGRRWALPVLLVSVAMLGAACGDSDDSPTVDGSSSQGTAPPPPQFAAGTTMAALQGKGKIVVGTKFDQPGLGQRNPVTGKVEGFDVEIAKLVAVGIFGGTVADIESKIEFKEATTPNRELFIENGTVDTVVATYTISDLRKERIDFAGPYFVAGQDIMVKAGDTSIRTVTDLNGKKVCSVRNSTPALRIRQQAPQADLTEFDTYTLCKDALLDGRVVAVSTDNVILLGFVAENPAGLKLVGNRFSDEPYGIGVKRGDDAFRTFVNDRLEQIYRGGEWAAAYARTLGPLGLQTPQPPAVNRYTSGAAGGAATTTTTTTVASTSTTVASTSTTARP